MPAAVIDPATWLARQDVAKRLDVGPVRVDQLAAQGRLEFVKTAAGRLFDPASVERFIEQRKNTGR